ncbi:MAG: tRNA pseudouridine(38-40) synthase TruA [Ignavibacteriales bacterium]|nr:tRNA pseudouridine(38-40) synthase TruA [Ignavibacteriales bacterium]
MSRYKIYIEYEGTRYSGWQIQKNARTVQGEIMSAIKTVFKTEDFEFYGSGRTDAGVHALEQIAHLDVQSMLAPQIIRMKLNDELPADVNILNVEKVLKNFHARHDAEARSYLYQISKRRTAFGKRFVWWIKDTLDVHQMNSASKLFLGMKNFQSFTADDPDDKSTKALVDEIKIHEDDNLIFIRITSSHFLWKMVRQIVGVLAEVGRGRLSTKDVERFLKIKSDEPAKYTAPPSGLFLEKVYYKGDERLVEIQPMLKM